MEKVIEKSLLYDFYGELLTDKQKEIYEDYFFNDLTLSEIAEAAGISRQGVHDSIKRSNLQLEKYEEKLHLVERFRISKEALYQINEELDQIKVEEDNINIDNVMERINSIKKITNNIIKNL